MAEFRTRDLLKFDDIQNGDRLDSLGFSVIAFRIEGEQWIQWGNFISGIPAYSLKVTQDLKFEAYKMGIQCTIKTLSKVCVTRLDSWSRPEEAL